MREHSPVRFHRTATGHIIIRARLDRRQWLDLLLDTGASRTLISASSPRLVGAELLTPKVQSAEAAGGAISAIQMVELETLYIGAWSFSGAAVMELAHLAERLEDRKSVV